MGRKIRFLSSRLLRLLFLLIFGASRYSFVSASAKASEQYRPGSVSPHSQIVTNIILLPDSSGHRFRREVVVSLNDSSEATPHGDLDSKRDHYSAEETEGSPRGHPTEPTDPLLEELENNVENNVDVANATENIKKRFKTEGIERGLNDTHMYYDQEFLNESKFSTYYQDLGEMNQTGLVKEHSMLSQSYRRAATINLSFKFPFYGHEVENITIATGGFLYTGDYVHSWLAATQYIAPLMANFDTSNNHQAKIRYLDDGKKLVVEWKNVYLQERESEGPFTFQVTLHNQGDIWFAYQKIPLQIGTIKDDDHPVKVGLSDAYIIDRTIYFARRKTIYEYHRLNLIHQEIRNETAIVFRALKTCNINRDCGTCLSLPEDPQTHLECRWCPDLSRCSDGTDRNRQDWLKRKCDIHNISVAQSCPPPGQMHSGNRPSEGQNHRTRYPDNQSAKMTDYGEHVIPADSTKVNPGTIVASVFSCLLLITLLGWVGYAYFNPNTASGRFLIKYRPGAWRWRQSGGRYTAASIHM